jgi:hypothetical protein
MRAAVLQIIVERPTDIGCFFLFSLDYSSKQAGYESHLTQNILLAHSFHLSFAFHVHHLVSLYSSPGGLPSKEAIPSASIASRQVIQRILEIRAAPPENLQGIPGRESVCPFLLPACPPCSCGRSGFSRALASASDALFLMSFHRSRASSSPCSRRLSHTRHKHCCLFPLWRANTLFTALA